MYVGVDYDIKLMKFIGRYLPGWHVDNEGLSILPIEIRIELNCKMWLHIVMSRSTFVVCILELQQSL